MTAPASASTGAPSPAPAAPHHEPNAAVDKRAKQADGEPVHAARNGVLRQRRLLSPRRRRRRGGAPGPRLGAQPAGAHRPAGPPLQARAFAPAWIRRDPSRIPASAPSMEKPPPPSPPPPSPTVAPRSSRAAARRRSVVQELEHLLDEESVDYLRWSWPGALPRSARARGGATAAVQGICAPPSVPAAGGAEALE